MISILRNPFQPGDKKVFLTTVTDEKLARFDAGLIHPVYSTFALGKDVEWACRLFVLDMLEEGEEGVGSYLAIQHLYPAPLGSKVKIEATLQAVNSNEIACLFDAFSNEKLIARGEQKQKIVHKAKFDQLIAEIKLHQQ